MVEYGYFLYLENIGIIYSDLETLKSQYLITNIYNFEFRFINFYYIESNILIYITYKEINMYNI